MYKTDTPNLLPLTTVRWTLVTVTIVLFQIPWAPKSLTNKGLREDVYMSIPRIMTITPINRGVLPCPNKY